MLLSANNVSDNSLLYIRNDKDPGIESEGAKHPHKTLLNTKSSGQEFDFYCLKNILNFLKDDMLCYFVSNYQKDSDVIFSQKLCVYLEILLLIHNHRQMSCRSHV